MSSWLYRCAHVAVLRPWWFLGAWAAIVVVIVGVLVANPPKLSSEIRIDGTAAQDAIDLLGERMPEASGGQGSVVFVAPDGQRIDATQTAAAIAQAVDGVFGSDHVIDPRPALASQATSAQGSESGPGAQDPSGPQPLLVDGRPVPSVLVAPDGSVALLQFQFDTQIFELPAGTVDGVVETARDTVEGTGVDVLPGSTLLAIPDIIGVGEIVGLAVAAIVLVVTLGSLVAAGLPLITALTGVAVGVGGAFALSSVLELNSLSVVLALMLGLAVGIDYALFIVNRTRRLILHDGLPAHEATARAAGTAGSAVLFAGATVIIALTALLVVGIELLSTMALIASVTVAIAVAVALTALPALLGLVGERLCSPKTRIRHALRSGRRSDTVATWWAQLLVRRRVVAAVAVVAGTALLALPMMDMRLGLPAGSNYNTGTEQRISYDAVASGFGPGFNGPLMIVAESTNADVLIAPESLVGLSGEIGALDGVAAATPAGISQDGATAVLSVIPTTGPTDEATEKLVTTIRSRSDTFAASYNLDVAVTGITAMGIDVSDKLSDVLPIYLAVVVGLSLIILLLVFRSIVVPLKATIGFLLSVLATFGVTTAVFQWGWFKDLLGFDTTTPVLSLLPIVITGVLYGLAMDYQVFLVSSIREAHVHGRHGTDAIIHGYNGAARVVVAAAIIMIAVFAGFVFNEDPMVKQVGFALAVGVAIDAFLIRLTLVPAVLAMFGDRAWTIPDWLNRALPNLDIEGDKLNTRLHHPEPATTHT
ncbi:MMPL family transporter [Rhodococcus erythropolis]|uniref:MMPL family transporter n=1 Tax=Rhodococcus erythropolis TaxID=1833 RepID=UPI0039C3393A